MDDTTDLICESAKNFHWYFSREIWPNHPDVVHFQTDNITISPCYHNEHHISGVIEASSVAVQQLIENQLDPFHIVSDLEKWNIQSNTQISKNEFKTILTIAFATHDLGNLTKSSEIKTIKEQIDLDYSDHFQLEIGPSEQRSSQLAIVLLNHFDKEHAFSEEMKDLIKHLIMQTVFVPTQTTSENPFWLLVQFIDQIGSYFFSGVSLHHASAGYLNELSVSANVTQRLPFSLKQFLSFFPNRFFQMVPDLDEREKILSLFDPQEQQRNLFHYYTEVPDRPIEYKIDVEEIFKGKWNKVS